MDIEEIFSRVSSRMVEGMMFHDQLANCYLFLGFDGFAVEHFERFTAESKGYQKLCRYYVEHYNRLMPETTLKDPDVIPSSWYKASRQDVDAKTKFMALLDGITKWVTWEQGTKEIFEKASKELYDGGAVAASIIIDKMVGDVDQELAQAQQEELWTDALDLATAMEAQHDKY